MRRLVVAIHRAAPRVECAAARQRIRLPVPHVGMAPYLVDAPLRLVRAAHRRCPCGQRTRRAGTVPHHEESGRTPVTRRHAGHRRRRLRLSRSDRPPRVGSRRSAGPHAVCPSRERHAPPGSSCTDRDSGQSGGSARGCRLDRVDGTRRHVSLHPTGWPHVGFVSWNVGVLASGQRSPQNQISRPAILDALRARHHGGGAPRGARRARHLSSTPVCRARRLDRVHDARAARVSR